MRFLLRVLIAAFALSTVPAWADEAAPAPITEADRERVRRLAKELETFRGATFKTEVGVERQTTEGFRAFVTRELDRSLPPAEATAQSKALQAFGLLPQGYDLRKGLLDLYVSQAGAYYDPETKKFYLLLVDLPADQMDEMILHELGHALQDQRFDLRALLAKAHATGDDDREAAVQHLVEGEATFLMILKGLARQGVPPDQLGGMAETVFSTMRDMDRPMLVANATLMKDQMAPDVKAAIEALAGLPDFLFWGLYGPYMRGHWAIYKTRAAKGWKGVDELFERPPASTEQVLHPEKAFAAERDEPVAVAAEDFAPLLGKGWQLVRANTLGEAGIRVLLETFLPKNGAQRLRAGNAASGWGGDRYEVYEGPGGKLALFWHTTWDVPDAARRFADAAKAMKRPVLGEVAIARRGEKDVWLVDGPKEEVRRWAEASAPAEAGK